MNKYLETLITNFFNLLSNFLSFLPRSFALFLGRVFARFVYYLAKFTPYRQILTQNIRITLPLSEKGCMQVAKKHIISLSENIVDLLRIPTLNNENIEQIVDFIDLEYYHQALNENKGIIMVSAHYGCWELLGVALSLKLNVKLNVLVQKPTNSAFDKLFFKYREMFNIKTNYNSDGIKGLRPLFRSLENNECLGFLIDQHGESEDTFGRFFGKIVSIPSGPAHFAYRTKAPILPAFIRKNKNNKHEVVFFPPIHIIEGDKEKEIYKVSQQLYKVIEKFIKNKPDEWLWLYERWNKLSVDGQEIVNSIENLKNREFLNESK